MNQNSNIFIHENAFELSSLKWQLFCPGGGGGVSTGLDTFDRVILLVLGFVIWETTFITQIMHLHRIILFS